MHQQHVRNGAPVAPAVRLCDPSGSAGTLVHARRHCGSRQTEENIWETSAHRASRKSEKIDKNCTNSIAQAETIIAEGQRLLQVRERCIGFADDIVTDYRECVPAREAATDR
jgi:hypothetical protein